LLDLESAVFDQHRPHFLQVRVGLGQAVAERSDVARARLPHLGRARRVSASRRLDKELGGEIRQRGEMDNARRNPCLVMAQTLRFGRSPARVQCSRRMERELGGEINRRRRQRGELEKTRRNRRLVMVWLRAGELPARRLAADRELGGEINRCRGQRWELEKTRRNRRLATLCLRAGELRVRKSAFAAGKQTIDFPDRRRSRIRRRAGEVAHQSGASDELRLVAHPQNLAD
jgi:hypothetical protein